MDSRDLFERYMQAVRKYLPWQRQDDIIAELRANLEAQREEREAEMGRPLSEGEMIDWLKELGPPAQMAARYQPPRYLIGPAMFPVYWHILRLVMLWLTIGYAVSIVARGTIESHGPGWVAGLVAAYPGIMLSTAAWVTGAFALLEYISVHYPKKWPDLQVWTSHWSPTSLPPVEKDPPIGTKPRTFTAAVAELVVQFALLIWLLLIPNYPVVVLGPGAALLEHSPVRLTHIVVMFFWAVVGLNVVQLGWQGFNLLTRNWRIRGKVQHLVFKLMGLIPIAILVAAPDHRYIEPVPAEAGRLPVGFDAATINHYVFQGLAVVALIVGIQFVWDFWKAISSERATRLRMVA